MNPFKVTALALIVGGLFALAYGSFTYTKETHTTQIGPVELSVKDDQTINIPRWAGAGAIILGTLVLLVRVKP